MEWKQLLCDDRVRNFRKNGSNDLRSEYEKDYHRIIGSASFRRLQDKTQVFPLDKSDFIRTRLTHSLEVSSFGKSLGQNISQRILKEEKDAGFLPEYQGYICDILQCAGLLHDIGNPPFGHFGESAIREWFCLNLPKKTVQLPGMKQEQPISEVLNEQMQQDFYHFEGNTQALRLVTKLHYLVDENGMNLTKALLGTIIKYPVSSLEIKATPHIKNKKMGYYYAERELFKNLQESLGTNGNRHPLAFVLEAADDIAYKTADIEDAVKKGCITYEQLVEELELAQEKIPEGRWKESFHKMVDKLQYYYGKAKKRELQNAKSNAVQNWVIYVQGWMIKAATDCFIWHYNEIMDGSYGANGEDLFSGTEGAYMMEALGDIAFRYAFQIKPILKLEIAAQSIFDFLLDKFIDAAIYFDTERKLTDVQKKMMSLVSDNYIAIYRHFAAGVAEDEKLYLRLLLVTDHICGMTDSYAKRLYQELKGID